MHPSMHLRVPRRSRTGLCFCAASHGIDNRSGESLEVQEADKELLLTTTGQRTPLLWRVPERNYWII